MSDHDASAQAVIGSELARVILGARGPARTELRMDSLGHLTRIARALDLQQAEIGARLLPVLRRAANAIRAAVTS